MAAALLEDKFLLEGPFNQNSRRTNDLSWESYSPFFRTFTGTTYVHIRLEFKEFLGCFVAMRLRLVFLLAHNF